jgi:hypothetical protein
MCARASTRQPPSMETISSRTDTRGCRTVRPVAVRRTRLIAISRPLRSASSAGLLLRLRVWRRSVQLDRSLAEGCALAHCAQHELRAQQLASLRVRWALATAFRAVAAEAKRPPSPPPFVPHVELPTLTRRDQASVSKSVASSDVAYDAKRRWSQATYDRNVSTSVAAHQIPAAAVAPRGGAGLRGSSEAVNGAGARGARELRRAAAIVWPLLQATAAATLAWVIATHGLGHEDPFFAPIAAVIALNTSGRVGSRGYGPMAAARARPRQPRSRARSQLPDPRHGAWDAV